MLCRIFSLTRKNCTIVLLKMAGDGEGAKLSGMAKIFNGQTTAGRANVGKATYAVIGLVIAYNVMKPKKK